MPRDARIAIPVVFITAALTLLILVGKMALANESRLTKLETETFISCSDLKEIKRDIKEIKRDMNILLGRQMGAEDGHVH